MPTTFLAIDFETADRGPDSACALGAVRVAGGRITRRGYWLIRPPRSAFTFTWLHGITWEMVAGERTFADVWPEVKPLIRGAAFIAAHNAWFDRRVLEACCGACGARPPRREYLCTVRLARHAWDIRPTRLPDVCGRLGIALEHHRALSDAEACARIVMRAQAEGFAEAFGPAAHGAPDAVLPAAVGLNEIHKIENHS